VAGRYDEHFGRLSSSYDAFRGQSRPEVLSELAALADMRGRTLLDIGCGTGADAALLAGEHAVKPAAAVDASPEMAAIARERLGPLGTEVRVARAEELPFAAGAFERALMNTVVHLLDRPRAFAEAGRVLDPGEGRLAIVTVDPDGVDDFWLADLFPSFARIDRERFPSRGALERDLRAAGFADVRLHPRPTRLRYTREQAIANLRARSVSSLALMDDDELAAGIERAERTLPAVIEPLLQHVLVVATRSGGML
jgi:ubiquinone/menaquinone biosynthesis C-methylase UbiE